MVKLILGLSAVPTPHDAADALAVAICHINSSGPDGTSRALAVQGGDQLASLPVQEEAGQAVTGEGMNGTPNAR